jgi:YgiT-type zinc finger domain-containing protein
MRCRVGGGLLERRVTDLPFKISDSSSVILKALPVLQCRQCGETELEHATMLRVDQVLADSLNKATIPSRRPKRTWVCWFGTGRMASLTSLCFT